MSVRPPRVLTRSFPLMTVPYTAGAPCSYWTLTWLAVSSALHSLMGFLFVSPVVCLQLPSNSISRWTPLLFGYPLPTAGRGRDFHPLERAPAGRTNEIKQAARVLSRYRDARVKKEPQSPASRFPQFLLQLLQTYLSYFPVGQLQLSQVDQKYNDTGSQISKKCKQ